MVWQNAWLVSGKELIASTQVRETNSDYVGNLKRENGDLKQAVT